MHQSRGPDPSRFPPSATLRSFDEYAEVTETWNDDDYAAYLESEASQCPITVSGPTLAYAGADNVQLAVGWTQLEY